MKRIAFTKMHGCGNDYIYVDATKYPIDNPQEASIRWSDRHKGIGADGLVLIDEVDDADADFSMRIFNADGSEALMCGNASRCIGKYLYEKGKVLELTVSEGVVEAVCVDMLEPNISDKQLFCKDEDPEIGVFVSMGNPHYVIFTDNVDKVEDMGPKFECHEAFPQRCNIEFADVKPDGSIRTRVWERGSGITMACGTGACATAVAAAMTGRTGRQTDIVMDGGTLHIEWKENNHVFLSGPAEFVFDGEIYL